MSAFDNIASKKGNKSFNTDSTQTSHKLNTDLTQTSHKLNTDLTQTSHKLNTDLTQTSHRLNTDLTQTSHRLNTDLTQTSHRLNTNPDTDLTQTQHKNEVHLDLYELSDMALKILKFIFEICVNSGEKTTPRLKNKNIANSLNINSKSVPTTIQRMIKKGYISRKINIKQDCRGSQYIISDYVYTKMMNFTQTSHKLNTNPDTNTDTNTSSNSNINNYKNTTTNDYEIFKKIINEINDDELEKVITDTEINNILNYRNQELNEDELKESLLDFIHDYNVAKADEKALGCDSFKLTGRFVIKMRNGYYSSNKARQERLEIQRREREESERYFEEKKALAKQTNENRFKTWLLSNDSKEVKENYNGYNLDFKEKLLWDYFLNNILPFN